MSYSASRFLATRNGFGYVKPKTFIIKHVLIKSSTKNQLLEQVNKRVDLMYSTDFLYKSTCM